MIMAETAAQKAKREAEEKQAKEAAQAAKDSTNDDQSEEVDDSLNGRLNRLWVEVNESFNDDAPGLKNRALNTIEQLQFALQELEPYAVEK